MSQWIIATCRGSGKASRLPAVPVSTRFHSNWLDNAKAKFLLGWRPIYDLKKLTDAAWEYQRRKDDLEKSGIPVE